MLVLEESAVSVIVPVMDEEDNVPPLLDRLGDVFRVNGLAGEVIFVDDSRGDGTGHAISVALREMEGLPFTVRHIHRKGSDRTGGLSGSVVLGLRNATAPVAIVMDGDLQHPPEVLPSLLGAIQAGHDIVPASRYCPGGSSEGLSGLVRQVVSKVSTLAARLTFPVALRKVTDPMTGFFAVRRQALDLDQLHGRGFKILLELLGRHPKLKRTEVPFEFAKREAGESKGTIKQGVEYLRHLASLRLRTLPRFVNFAIGGASIALLGLAMMAGMVRAGVSPVWANTVQLVVTLALNFLYNWGVTWRGQPRERLFHQMFLFGASRGTTQLVNWFVSSYLLVAGWHYLLVVPMCLAAATGINFATSWMIFRPRKPILSEVM